MNILNFLKLILSKGKKNNPYLDPHYDQNTTYYKTKRSLTRYNFVKKDIF